MAKYLDSVGLNRLMEIIKAAFVTDVTYNTTSKKIQKSKAGSTSDVVDLAEVLAEVAFTNDYDDLDNLPTIPSGVSPYDSNPAMDGTASPGSSTLFSRGDHVHPTDTSRAANTDFVGSSVFGQAGTHGLVPAPPQKQAGTKPYILLDDGYWHGGWMDLYFDTTADEYKLRIRYMEADGTTQTTLWETTIPAVTTTDRGMMRATDKVKLDGIATGAEVNVQSDWSQSDTTADDYIKNKPTIPTVPGDFTGATSSAAGAHGLVPAPGSGKQKSLLWGNGTWDEIAMSFGRNASDGLYLNWYGAGDLTNRISWTKVPDATTSLPGAMSASDKTKLDSIATGAEVNVQSNWNQTTTTADDYIKNKPSLGTAAAKTVGAASGNLQENGAALSASKAVVTDANKKFVSSSYSLGAACEKSIGSVADGDTGLVTGDAVYDAIQSSIAGIVGNLVYKGTVSAASGMSNFKTGWSWIASAAFTIGSGSSAKSVEVGDMLIANADGTSATTSNIDVIQTNIDTLTTGEVETLWANAVPTA